MQLYLSIGIPSFLVVLAMLTNYGLWVSSRSEITRLSEKVDRNGEVLRAEMISLRKDINAEFVAFRREISTDMVAFRREVNSDFVAFRKEVHADLLMLHERVVKVETKQDGE